MITYDEYNILKRKKWEYISESRDSNKLGFSVNSTNLQNEMALTIFENCEAVNFNISSHESKIEYTNDFKVVILYITEDQIDYVWEKYIPLCNDLHYLSIEDRLCMNELLFELKDLKYLNLQECAVNSYFDKIFKMTSLEVLYMDEADIDEIPHEIRNLNNLRALSIMDTKITTLPDCLSELKKLRYLGLNGTKIKEVPDSISKLENLESLYLGRTEIEFLPKELQCLTKMKHLALWGTKLYELPCWICNFKNLKGLYLGHTERIKELPSKIGNLVNLEYLYLNDTQISELPDSFSQLINLKRLLLNNTKIRRFPKLSSSLELEECNLSNLVLENIPRELINPNIRISFNNEYINKDIVLHNTKILCQPISLFSHDKEFIYAYYDEEKIHLNESKIVFLGDGESGKSHIIKRICKNGKIIDAIEYQATPGIDIVAKQCEIGKEHMNLQLWDFGGQDILHSMHRFFLTDRTLYVIVINARDNTQNERARYWLNNVKSFANGCPVM